MEGEEYEETVMVYDSESKVVIVKKSDSAIIVILGFAILLLLAFEQFLIAPLVLPFLIYNILNRDITEFDFNADQIFSFSSFLQFKFRSKTPVSFARVKKILVVGRFSHPDKEVSFYKPFLYEFSLILDDVRIELPLSVELLPTAQRIHELLLNKGFNVRLKIDESEIARSKYG